MLYLDVKHHTMQACVYMQHYTIYAIYICALLYYAATCICEAPFYICNMHCAFGQHFATYATLCICATPRYAALSVHMCNNMT